MTKEETVSELRQKLHEAREDLAVMTARAELAEEEAIEGWTETLSLAIQYRGLNGMAPISAARKRLDLVKMRTGK
jgi:hypothetical protein